MNNNSSAFLERNMETFFLTKEQKQILDIQLLYPQSSICNIGGMLHVKNEQNEELPVKAMRYAIENTGMYHIQINKKNVPYKVDGTTKIDKWEGTEEPSAEDLNNWMKQPFPFYDTPLYEIKYWSGTDEVKLYMKAHHILVDGYSFVVTLNRVSAYYTKLLNHEKINSEPDNVFIEQMKEDSRNTELERLWLEKAVPTDMPQQWQIKKTEAGKVESKRKIYYLSDSLYKEWKLLKQKENVSYEAIFYAALSIYLSKTTGSSLICLGRSMINRRKNEMAMSGIKVNQMPVFIDVSEKDSFYRQCKKTNRILLEMMRYSDVSFSEYLKENKRTNEYFDMAVSYRNERILPIWDGVEQQELANGHLELPMRFYLAEMKNGIRIEIQYQTAQYSEMEVDRILQRIYCVMKQGMRNVDICHISILTEEDNKLWAELNKGRETQVSKRLLLDSIRDYSQTAENPAVVFENRTVSYAELWDKSDRVACWLLENQVSARDIVAVQMRISELLPIVFLGIWKAGASFLPVAVGESKKRVDSIRSICSCIMTERQAEEAICFSKKRKLADVQPSMPAYCMYTSGSTGAPKLVVISHESLAWRVNWMVQQYGHPGPILQKAAYTFDVSMWEFFLPLITGETVYLLKENDRANPQKIAELLLKGKIGTVHFIPSMLGLFLDYVETRKITFPALKHVYSSGEVLPASMAAGFYRCFKDTVLHNLYGPTECTIDVTYYDCTGKEERVPIGTPLPGTTVEILDDAGRCVPVGVEGELSIGGVLVGEGYFKQKSEQYYFDNIWNEKKYKTGDRAMLGFDGQIYFLGRKDQQCKVNGMRIDLKQIENGMLTIPGMKRAAVLIIKKQLIGCYMAKAPIADISKQVADLLPIYSVPAKFVYLEEIPLTKNGKVDYAYLEEYLKTVENSKSIKKPHNKAEYALVTCLQDKMGVNVSANENLFLAGLDSLKLMEVLLELEQRGYHYTPEEFYENKTVQKIVNSKAEKIQWLYKGNNTKAIIAFPFAAGTADAYVPLAELARKRHIDFGVTHAADIQNEIAHYEKVVLLGYCTGTVLALETFEYLESMQEKIVGVVLCAALPPGEKIKQYGSPWRFLNDRGIAGLMRYLHREKIRVSKSMIKIFRHDVTHFVSYFKEAHNIKCHKILFCFGGRDLLTWNCAHRWQEWKKYLHGPARVIIFKKEYHFFLKEKKKEIIREIVKLLE